MGKHSKNVNTNAQFGYRERKRANNESWGSLSQRVASNSNLPFGYCALTLRPTTSCVATPSGHLYEKEAILEYILHHLKKVSEEEEEVEEEKIRIKKKEEEEKAEEAIKEKEIFKSLVDGGNIKPTEATFQATGKRKREIDDSSNEERIAQLSKSSPWLPAFTPSAENNSRMRNSCNSSYKKKRATSPFSGRPLRAKDLIPLDLQRDKEGDGLVPVHYVCSVSKKVITTQPVVAIKTTHAVMLEEVAQTVAYPSQTCPVTGTTFQKDRDILVLQRAQTAFAGSGATEVSVKRQALV